MNRLARRYGFDVLIVIGAIGAVVEVVVWDDMTDNLWFSVPAVALIVLTLLGRRRFPFAAPAAAWLLAAVAAFVDGLLMVDNFCVFAAAITASFLLGNLPDVAQAGPGWRSRPARRRSSSTTTRSTPPGATSSSRRCSRSRGSAATRCANAPSRPSTRSSRNGSGSRESCTTSSPTT